MSASKVPGPLGERLRECGSLLQVALDVVSIREALRTGYHSLVSPAVILEAGTPLVKSVGLAEASLLRALPQEPIVVADLKTMDTGRLEVNLAADHGFHASTVLSVAPEQTISEAAEAAGERGIALYGDLIGQGDPVKAAGKLRRLGVHIALLHIGIDVQRSLGITAGQLPELVSRVKEAFGGPVAVAGGVRPGDAGNLARVGADIIIIGSAITRAENPRQAALDAVRSLRPGCL
ncbi:MAG: orotidine 5'-phosphate decarboxylase [Desulfurococcales archaeon]|nr:orotidine 5'-phosphate decarboxylase [Desulfurococcales archaeon]